MAQVHVGVKGGGREKQQVWEGDAVSGEGVNKSKRKIKDLRGGQEKWTKEELDVISVFIQSRELICVQVKRLMKL